MKLTDKMKRNLAIGGGAVVCVALIVAIGLQIGRNPAVEETLPADDSIQAEIVIQPGDQTVTGEETSAEEASTEEKELLIQTNSATKASDIESSQTVDPRPAQTDQPEQSIQPEVTKPVEPEESIMTDPTQKPDGTKLEEPPVSIEHEDVIIPAETEPDPGQPQGGDVQDGKTYFPGFGWVEGTGDSHGTTADDMYENGNKIGNMGE
ncbi:DUF6550 family protein [Hungatella hathewayi]